jgi:hypothetical protein
MVLYVNVNKVATLRNSRGGAVPSVIDAVNVCVEAARLGYTVHPAPISGTSRRGRPGRGAALRESAPGVEFNIEGDPRSDLLDLVAEVRPTQCTLVPVVPGEITSQAGWQPASHGRRASPTTAARIPMSCAGCTRTTRASACSSTPSPTPFAGRRRRAPIASSCTPSRSRARSSAAPRAGASRSRRSSDSR